eukprot:5644452-Amphidinium_carterae.2
MQRAGVNSPKLSFISAQTHTHTHTPFRRSALHCVQNSSWRASLHTLPLVETGYELSGRSFTLRYLTRAFKIEITS